MRERYRTAFWPSKVHELLEFSAPRFLHADTAGENRRLIREASTGAAVPEPSASLKARPSAETLLERARMLEGSGGFAWALETFGEALAADPLSVAAAEGLARTSLRLGRAPAAEATLRQVADGSGPLSGRVGLALLAHNQGQPEPALARLAEAAALDPNDRRVLLLGAEVQQATGNLEAATGLAQAALTLDPRDAEAEALLAALALEGGRIDEAGRRAEAVLVRAPRQAQALEVAAIVRAGAGDRDSARRAFEALRQAVTLHPGNVAGYRGLAEAARVLGDRALADYAQAALTRLGAI